MKKIQHKYIKFYQKTFNEDAASFKWVINLIKHILAGL